MSSTYLAVKARNQLLLTNVLVELTYRCNLDCFFCYNDLGLRGTPVPTERYLELWQELADLQVLELVLTGGEPLAHPDFLLLGERARELGFAVRIKSNGHSLTAALASEIKSRVDPYVIDVSLHGATAEVHDRQTRVEGSFDRLLKHLRSAVEAGLRVHLNTTMTSWNEHQIDEMHEVAEALGLRLRVVAQVSPRDDGDTTPLRIRPSMEAVSAAASSPWQQKLVEDAGPAEPAPDDAQLNCGTGATSLTIDPFGNVLPCMQWRNRKLGNIHDTTIGEIWGGSPELEEVRRLNREAMARRREIGGEALSKGICLALSEMHTGDPLAVGGDTADVEIPARGGEYSRRLLPVIR